MKIAVKHLRPNPFRDLARYPVDPDKIEALVQSIKETDFWDNLVARPGSNGDYELAYGVHRLKALQKAHITEVDLPVRKLSDDLMIKMMVHENQTEWATSALVEQESIRAVITAYGEGKIELPKPNSNCGRKQLRFAPSFVAGDLTPAPGSVPYTKETLSKYLGGEKAGWSERKIEAILDTLATMEKGLVERGDLEGLSTYQAEEVARQARRVERETGKPDLAKTIGKRLAGGMKTATGRPPGRGGVKKGSGQAITYHGAKRAADEMMGSHRSKTKPKKMPPVERFADDLSDYLLRSIPSAAMVEKLEALIQFRKEIRREHIRHVAGALRGCAQRLMKYADKLEA